jgi:HlyD family secretion protein
MSRTASWLSLTICMAVAVCWMSVPRANSQEASKPNTSDAAAPALIKAETGKVTIETSLKGTIEAALTSELLLEAKSFAGPFTVKTAVPHGTRVKKGDVVLEFDTLKIDQALSDLRIEQELAEISLKQAKEELMILERTLPLNLAAAERDKRIAEEDFKRYTDIERAHQLKSAEQQLKSQQQWLEYSQEELKQLQKMYRDKDLTEETEEIILKRQRNQIEQLEFAIETLKQQQEREKLLDRPRRDQAMKDGLEKQNLAWLKAQSSLPKELQQKRLALQKQEIERARTEERHKHLEEDRASMILRAPIDGIVYHGHADRGQWNTASISSRLKQNGVIQPKEVVMTVVATRPLFVRADVEEKELHSLSAGQTGQAVLVGFPKQKLSARLKSLSLVPRTAGTFEALIDIDIPDDVQTVLPGMTVNVKLTTYQNESAVLVPTTAIFHDEGSDFSYVLVKADKSPVRTEVETGHVTGSKTEVVHGLTEGTEILAKKP